MKLIRSLLALALCLTLCVSSSISAQNAKPRLLETSPKVRIQDLVELHGIRPNILTGRGLVTGLKGTGDGTVATRQALVSYLAKTNLRVRIDQVASGNIALVNISAALPPFARHGTRLDVEVSSIGEAPSLRGGTLLLTELRGSDGKVYALAQGPLVIGGFEAKGSNAKITKNHPTAGSIPNGAICEPPVEELLTNILNEQGEISLLLRNPSAENARRITTAINGFLRSKGIGVCTIADAGNVRVGLVAHYRDPGSVTSLLADIQALRIEPIVDARIIINEKTGTIIAGRDVRITPCIMHISDLVIEIADEPLVSQPNPGISRGTTKEVTKTQIRVTVESGRPRIVDGGGSMRDLIQGLQSLGIDGQKMMMVLTEIHSAGYLHGTLVPR